MRRAGKTTFLHQLRRFYHEQGFPLERLPYINLEDDRLAGFDLSDFSLLIEEYYRRFPEFRGQQTVVWCFDEIQVVPGWERFIRRLMDTEKVIIFISGSSAALLSREIATAMRGRAWEVVVFPFSFEEFLRHNSYIRPRRTDLLPPEQRSLIEGAFRKYLTTGGFPEVQGVSALILQRLLSDYVDVALLRDIVERHQVSNVVSLRWLVRHLLGNPGALFSVEKFHATLKSQGLAVSRDTLHQLLNYLEDSFLVRLTWVDSDSERRRMVNPRKVYPLDPGLIPVFDRSGKANIGHALETAVRVELERRGLEIHYVRTQNGYEVDFITRSPEGERMLIQVCADLAEPDTQKREIRALLDAASEYPEASLHIITLRPERFSNLPPAIQLHNAPFWFLKPWIDKQDTV